MKTAVESSKDLSNIRENLITNLVADFESDILKNREILAPISDSIDNYIQKGAVGKEFNSFSESIKFHDEIFNTVKDLQLYGGDKKFTDDFPSYFSYVNKLIDETDEYELVVQDEKLFSCAKDDKKTVCLIRKFKKIFFSVHKFIFNLIKFIPFTKAHKIKKFPGWVRNVPRKNILKYSLHYQILDYLMPVIDENRRNILELYHDSYKDIRSIRIKGKTVNGEEDKSPPEENRGEQRKLELSQAVKDKIESIADSIVSQIAHYLDTADTLELSASYFSSGRLSRIDKLYGRLYSRKREKWSNYGRAITEVWSLYENISLVNHSILDNAEKEEKTARKKLTELIEPKFSSIQSILTEAKKNILTAINSRNNQLLTKTKSKIENELNNSEILKTVNLLEFDNPIVHLRIFRKKLDKLIDEIPETRIIVREKDFDQNISKKDFHEIQIRELVYYTLLNEYDRDTDQIISSSEEGLKKIKTSLLEIGQIAEYNVESAFSFRDSEKQDEDIKFVTEGLDNAIKKNEAIRLELTKLYNDLFKELNENSSVFTSEFDKFNNIDRLIALKIKVSKEKSIEKTRATLELIKEKTKHFIPLIYRYIRFSGKKIYDTARDYTSKVGISDTSKGVTVELIEFLNESERVLGNLPYIYQRLFKYEPLSDPKFFIGRDEELNKFKVLYEQWQKENYASVALVGEKGGGSSTVINFLLKEIEDRFEVTRITLKENIYQEDKLHSLLKDLLKIDKFSSSDELVQCINDLPDKKIAVIENFEELYLRIPQGFDAIKVMLDIIARTNKKILWIITCNVYAWQYLQRVIQIEDYIAFKIELKKLADQKITEIILKRHVVSGYNLYFHPSDSQTSSKSFQKLTESQRQDLLKEEFFSDLNKFSESNIALALMLWLRSIKNLKENIMEISSLKGLDFSFLSKLSNDKLFTLMSLITHNGLSLEEHALIFKLDKDESRSHLLSMMDDGIILEGENVFNINFLLYRAVVNTLKNKNIIH